MKLAAGLCWGFCVAYAWGEPANPLQLLLVGLLGLGLLWKAAR